METNYRNTAEILEAARAIVAGTSFTDIEGTATAASAPSAPRHGARPEFVSFPSPDAHDAAMIARVRSAVGAVDVGLGDVAVLCFTNWQVKRAVKLFTDAGIPVVELSDYDGRISDKLKVGTIKRSKGLEFKQVLVPWVSPGLARPRKAETGDSSAWSEREDRDRRELFVGVTRARDEVWVGSHRRSR